MIGVPIDGRATSMTPQISTDRGHHDAHTACRRTRGDHPVTDDRGHQHQHQPDDRRQREHRPGLHAAVAEPDLEVRRQPGQHDRDQRIHAHHQQGAEDETPRGQDASPRHGRFVGTRFLCARLPRSTVGGVRPLAPHGQPDDAPEQARRGEADQCLSPAETDGDHRERRCDGYLRDRRGAGEQRRRQPALGGRMPRVGRGVQQCRTGPLGQPRGTTGSPPARRRRPRRPVAASRRPSTEPTPPAPSAASSTI